jgi:glycosyltransferase involved in cell wall biosynthesis
MNTGPLKVLYLHLIGPFGGASRSLFEAVRAFPPGAVLAHFVTQRGSVEPYFAQLGEVESARGMAKFDHTQYSHYRGARWLVALRELAYLPFTLAALRRARARWGHRFDLIHLNEFTGLPALWLARRLFGAPAVVHVRSVVHDDARLARTRWLHRWLSREAAALVAIDDNVRASLPERMPVEVIHNAFAPALAAGTDAAFEARLGVLRAGSFKVGFVGNLLLVKGILDLVEAARLLAERGVDVEFLVAGDDVQPSRGVKAALLRRAGLAQNVRAEVESVLDANALRDRFHLLGFTREIARAYACMDVLCFPSHYDAPGRPIFEAAFFGVPSIVAVRQPRADTLVHEVTGLAVHPRAPVQLADAIERLARNREAARRMGEAARAMAERNFGVQRNAARLLDLYRRTAGRAAA